MEGTILDNPVVLSVTIMILVWVIKTLGWARDGWQSTGLVAVMAIVLAAIQTALTGGFAAVTGDRFLEVAGQLLILSQIMYLPLRAAVATYEGLKARQARSNALPPWTGNGLA